ncbi:hypothetical protein [Rhodovibrio sodomensis]|uniref:hypothetical protein n=1 Tax=Rhodovibrio sodomensis TaxID=1088 RepID=UPI001907E49B
MAENGEEIGQKELSLPLSRKVLSYLDGTSDGVATFLGAYRLPDLNAELLVLEVETSRPQRPAYPIHRSEMVGVVTVADGPPATLALREDFPDTVHQNWMPEGLPRSLCVDDRPWAEAKATFTGGELIERIATWFRKAGRGELHDASQPIDPLFVGTIANIVVPASVWDAEGGTRSDLFAFAKSCSATTTVAGPVASPRNLTGGWLSLSPRFPPGVAVRSPS